MVSGKVPVISFKGFGWDKELIQRMEHVSGCPATTGLTAAVDAFRALSAKKVVMATPQRHEVDRRIQKFLEDSGIEVIKVKSLNLDTNRKIQELPESAAYETLRETYLAAPEAEGIYNPCGVWGSPAIIDYLEGDFGKPVVTNQQASLWLGLKALKIKDRVKDYGRLFEMT